MRKHFQFNDGGRAAAGYKGKAGDCVVRAIAIATGHPYQQIYDIVNHAATFERTGKRKRGVSDARTGVYRTSIKRVMKSLGWTWTPTMQIGSGCLVHLRADELPPGRLVVSVSKHLTAVVDGVIHDTHDCSRRGTRCVYGYWQPGGASHKATVETFRPAVGAERMRLSAAAERARPAMVAEKKPPAPSSETKRPKSFFEWLFG